MKYPLRFIDGKHYKNINHKKYKYELLETYRILCPDYISVRFTGLNQYPECIANEWFSFLPTKEGVYLCAKKGYCWDGASGPTWDDKTNMRASLVHDCFWQAIDEKILGRLFIQPSNKFFKEILIEDGMWKFRANYYYWVVNNPLVIRWKLGK